MSSGGRGGGRPPYATGDDADERDDAAGVRSSTPPSASASASASASGGGGEGVVPRLLRLLAHLRPPAPRDDVGIPVTAEVHDSELQQRAAQDARFQLEREDPYRLLGVTPAASSAEITARYRMLAKFYHPDKLSGLPPAERTYRERVFRAISAAHTLLSDPARRRAHDEQTRGIVGQLVSARGISQVVCDIGEALGVHLNSDEVEQRVRQVGAAAKQVSSRMVSTVADAVQDFSSAATSAAAAASSQRQQQQQQQQQRARGYPAGAPAADGASGWGPDPAGDDIVQQRRRRRRQNFGDDTGA